MKTYLVTGGCGFIGSHVIDQLLLQNDVKIINVDKLGIGSNIDNVQHSDRVTNYYVDITDDYIFEIYETHKPDYIIHCAAESHVDRSISDPISFVDSNVKGTANILECLRRYTPNSRMVHVSTDEVYGHLDLGDPPFTELTPINPRSPYSASKASSDLLALSYTTTYGLDITVTRCCNNYGPRQFTEKLIPTAINAIKSGKKIPVYGKGENIREWIYVEDHAKALIEVCNMQNSRKLYNIYGTKELSNISLLSFIIDSIVKYFPEYKRESFVDYIEYVQDRKGHDFKYAMSSLFGDVTTLSNQIPFIEGIEKTILSYLS
jgi:dTDP-glucose 4,6-dehydratase